MTSHDTPEIDEQLAAEMQRRSLQRAHDEWATKLQAVCNEHDAAIGDALNAIRSHVTEFNKEKVRILATLKSVEGDERSRGILAIGIDKMAPSTFESIQRLTWHTSGSYVTPVPSPLAALPIPKLPMTPQDPAPEATMTDVYDPPMGTSATPRLPPGPQQSSSASTAPKTVLKVGGS
jgi:hypothetical protein